MDDRKAIVDHEFQRMIARVVASARRVKSRGLPPMRRTAPASRKGLAQMTNGRLLKEMWVHQLREDNRGKELSGQFISDELARRGLVESQRQWDTARLYGREARERVEDLEDDAARYREAVRAADRDHRVGVLSDAAAVGMVAGASMTVAAAVGEFRELMAEADALGVSDSVVAVEPMTTGDRAEEVPPLESVEFAYAAFPEGVDAALAQEEAVATESSEGTLESVSAVVEESEPVLE